MAKTTKDNIRNYELALDNYENALDLLLDYLIGVKKRREEEGMETSESELS